MSRTTRKHAWDKFQVKLLVRFNAKEIDVINELVEDLLDEMELT